MRRRLITVRLPGARMAPTSRISAWRRLLAETLPAYRIVRFAASAQITA